MKKTIFIIFAIMLAAVMLIGCAPIADDPQDGVHPETVKAIIESVTEGSLLVQPLEGLDNIDVIYLNIGDDTVMNISDDAPLAPGTIVYAKIANAIMESYPPQVHLIEIIKTEIDDSITLVPIMDTPADDTTDPDTQLAPDEYITAKVTAIDGDTYTIEVLSANLYSGTMTLIIPSDVLDADMPIELGYLIGVYIKADGDTYTAEKLVFSEPDTMVTLDPRENISGYLDGMFPSAVYTMDDEALHAKAGVTFAIALDENCESAWTMTPQDGVTLKAQGTSEPREDGSYTNYFGIVIDTPGEYTLEFIHSTPEQDFDYTFTVTVE